MTKEKHFHQRAAMTTATKKTRRKRENSKSGAIRAYLKRKPDAGPTEIVNALKKKGVAISPAHVSNVKAALRKSAQVDGEVIAVGNGIYGRGGARRGRKRTPDAISLGSLIEARAFAARVGGVEQARNLLTALAKLQG
jgi:hypothetical protein